MVEYKGEPHPERSGGIGVLVVNLGTPEAPTAQALRPYLRDFLSDPRVIELPAWKWKPILHGIVLRTRPRQSAALYRKVWTREGSPLLSITRRQAEALQKVLAAEMSTPVHVVAAMRIGRPSLADGLEALRARGCRRVLVLPMFPQYSGTTTGSVFDGVAHELTRWRYVPELRFVHGWHDEPGYVAALAATVREAWTERGRPARLLVSFHGLPQRYSDAGDPYERQCRETARLLAERLGLAPHEYEVAFQSRFGREEWLKPYTDETVRALGREGVAPVHVVAPAFSADCLETLEELDGLNREFYVHAGGKSEEYHYIPALNDRPDHVRFLADLVKRHVQGWA